MKNNKNKKKNSPIILNRTETKSSEDERPMRKKSRKKKVNSKEGELQGLIESSITENGTNNELSKNLSNQSIKTNSKILNDVLCDLSSLSSETIQTNIELSDFDKQRIERLKAHKKEPSSSNIRTFRKRFIFDVSYLKTCSFFKQLLIISFCVLMVLDGCIFRDAFSSRQNLTAALQVVFASITILILFTIITFYLCHYVGQFPQNSWLICEFYIYFVLAIFYFLDTIILFSIGSNFSVQGVFGIFIFLNFFTLALTKLMMAHLKISAQKCVEDPDGNIERAKDPNSRFVFPKRKLLRVWTV